MSERSDPQAAPAAVTARRRPTSAKLIVAGGFGVGKTTFVGAVSEIAALRTEAPMTSAAAGVDDASLVSGKTTTTVAMDFGRITVDAGLVLYLFGTPGQDRFGFMWDDMVEGGLGAVVLVDTRRLDACYGAIDYFERRRVPFVVALNRFDGAPRHDPDEVREALNVAAEIPLTEVDARSTESVKRALILLLDHILALLARPAPVPARRGPVLTAAQANRAMAAIESERGPG